MARPRRARRALLALFLLISFTGIAVAVISKHRIDRVWDVPVAKLNAHRSVDSLMRGAHLAATLSCSNCHGQDLGGRVMAKDAFTGTIVASNLTDGGVGKRYTDAQMARAIRHGIDADGHSLVVMPSDAYFGLSDDDVDALIAYIRMQPPVERKQPETHLGFGARTLMVLFGDPMLVAGTIDHDAERLPKPPEGPTAAYGRYVAAMCTSCHGKDFGGGTIHGPPGAPSSTNLTPGGPMADWTEEQFISAVREGKLPDGRRMNPAYMPWTSFYHFDDNEVRALWRYLKSLPSIS